ncbi:MAG: glycosyltransferase family 4 protein, partial [Candidatus Limnocylindria bacterium]
FERHCYRPDRLDRVIAVSAALRNELVAAFPALHDRVRVIPNGTDTARFRPNTGDRAAVREQLGLLPNGLVAIFAGGDWPRKGLHIAIEAIAEASGWELLVIGRGDAEKHRRRAVDAGVAGRVHFAGAVGDPERYFAAADVFVLPTAYEGFPLVSIEAAATGLPLLMTREANAEAVLTDGVSGCVLPREAATFARSLCELGADPARRARLGSAARTAALALDWRGIVDQHEAVYREMLHRARKA